MNNIDDIQTIATEAKEGFDLMARLEGRPTRTKDVPVYTDEVLGEQHATVLRQLQAAKLTSSNPEDYESLATEERILASRVYATGFTVSLRAVPRIVIKKADRETRKALGIKGTPHPDVVEEFSEQYTARVLRDSIEKITDHKTKSVKTDLTVDEVRALGDFLPAGEFTKIDTAMNDLSLTAQISDAITADADF